MRKGLIAGLFDLSFDALVATRLIRRLYLLAIVLVAIVFLGLVAVGFSVGPGTGVVMLVIVAPLIALGLLLYARVALEFVIALLRIMENTGELVRQGRVPAQTGPAPTPISAVPAADSRAG